MDRVMMSGVHMTEQFQVLRRAPRRPATSPSPPSPTSRVGRGCLHGRIAIPTACPASRRALWTLGPPRHSTCKWSQKMVPAEPQCRALVLSTCMLVFQASGERCCHAVSCVAEPEVRCGWCAAMALERMESNITAVLRQDMECIAAVHCLKVGAASPAISLTPCTALMTAA